MSRSPVEKVAVRGVGWLGGRREPQSETRQPGLDS